MHAQALHPAHLVEHVRAWPRRVLVTIVAILVVLVGVRIALPYVIANQINKRLEDIPGYRGHVDEVHLNLLRGAYTLVGISIYRVNSGREDPFFLARTIDFSIAWRELFHGKIVSDIYIDRGSLTIVQGPTPETSQKDTDRRWQSVIQDIFPIDIQHLEVTKGLIRYIDDTRRPKVDLFVKNMEAVATGLQNRPSDTHQEFPAKIQIQGDSLGGGRLTLLANAEPLAAKPHFHLSLRLMGVNLPDLNESLRSVANVDVGRGRFDLVVEMAGRDGAFQGYVKPFFTDLDFKSTEDKHEGLAHRLWERLVSGVAWLVKNKSRDQVATRVPFQGEFGDSQVGLWATVRNIFRHGFVKAFNPVVEGSVNPDKVPPPEEISPNKAPKAEQKKAEKQLEQNNDAKAGAIGQ